MDKEFSITSIDQELSNSLPFKVADEITRMRQRIVALSPDVSGIIPLLKSLDRLEEELNKLGFELPVLLDIPYDEGMTLKARFVPTNALEHDKKIITKVIKPQINYNGHLVQVAEVEVSIGT